MILICELNGKTKQYMAEKKTTQRAKKDRQKSPKPIAVEINLLGNI
jgi:hypothetical protein